MKYSMRPAGRWIVAALAFAVALSPASSAIAAVAREVVATGLSFPVYVTNPPGDTDRHFVVERAGLIKIIDLNTNTVLDTPFLDVNASPNTDVDTAGEGGLLSLAFHPDYASNGFFFVYYTTSLPGTGFTTRVSRFTVTASPDVASAASETIFFELDQPFTNHNGGMVAFRPFDSNHYLYVGLGDGGSGCDPFLTAQDLASKLGKMLRLDVDAGPSGDLANPFAPPSNPFVGVAGDDLIWDLGLRNPFRFSFDRLTADLYIGDVGQNTREEVDFEPAGSAGGLNFGWNAREGTIATPCPTVSPTLPEMIEPIHDYDHNGLGASVSGGNVYRGLQYPSMYGRYFFADFVTGEVWSFVRLGAGISDLQDHTAVLNPDGQNIVSFGEDGLGDLYIIEFSGTVSRIKDSAAVDLDQDLLADLFETNTGVFVSATDTGTDPGDPDSDGDGVLDGTEVALGTDPNNPPPSSNGGGTCFIATAAYGTPLAGQIGALREWRDSRLLRNALGATLTDSYYRLGPPAATYIATRPAMRAAARAVIAPVTWLVADDAHQIAAYAVVMVVLAGLALFKIAGRRLDRRRV
jgi:glucose/arabinose dehydrogenase